MADMKKILAAVDMLLEGLGLSEEETSEETDTESTGDTGSESSDEQSTDEEDKVDMAEKQEGGDTEEDKKKDKEAVNNSVKKALAPLLSKIQKSDSQIALVMEKLIKANSEIVEKQKAQDDAFGLLLDGFGLKEKVMKSHEERNKPTPGKATMEDVLLAINKSNETVAQAILANTQNGGNFSVNKSTPHSTSIMQNGFGRSGQEQQGNIDSVVNKDFLEGFGRVLNFNKRQA